MKRLLFILLVIIIPSFAFTQENAKVDSLQHEINLLYERIDFLKNEIQDEILENGYLLIAKSPYSYSKPAIILKDKESGVVIDTIVDGDSIKIIDKTISCFKVLFNEKVGYINTYEIEIKDYPALNFLESSYLRKAKGSNSDYSTGKGGSVNVKGYYRKDGTYVKSHTRSSGGRRR